MLGKPPSRLSRGSRGVFSAIQIGLDRADVASAIDAQLRAALPLGMPILHVPEFGALELPREAIREALADELSL